MKSTKQRKKNISLDVVIFISCIMALIFALSYFEGDITGAAILTTPINSLEANVTVENCTEELCGAMEEPAIDIPLISPPVEELVEEDIEEAEEITDLIVVPPVEEPAEEETEEAAEELVKEPIEEEVIEAVVIEPIEKIISEPVVDESTNGVDEKTVDNDIGVMGVINILASPIAGNVTVNSTSNTNISSENLTAYWDITDTDGDDVKNITNWKVNDTSITVLTMLFENDSNNFSGDYSGFENNASFNNATWNATGGYDGKGAYEFEGFGNQLAITSDDFKTSAATWSLWFKKELSGATIGLLNLFKSSDQQFWLYSDHLNRIVFYDDVAGDNAYETSSTTPTVGSWGHVAVVFFEDGTKNLYFNGDHVFTDSDGSNLSGIPNGASLYIGALSTGAFSWNGTIDDIQIFNRSLSADQIQAIYENKTYLISSDETFKGENWSACITPNDGGVSGATECSVNLNILNTPPSTTSVLLNATSINNYTLNNLTCYATFADNDSDPIYANYTWYNNSIVHLVGQSGPYTVGIEVNVANLTSDNTTKGQNWSCEVQGYDGTDNETTWTESFNVTILNTPPTQGTPIVNLSDGISWATENITVHNVSTLDDDGDSVKNIINWELNGTSITLLNLPFEKVDDSDVNATKDYSSNDNNGSEMSGVLWNASGGYDGKGAYEFDGVNDQIIVTSNDFGVPNSTLSIWFKDELAGGTSTLFDLYKANDHTFIVYTDSSERIMFYDDLGGENAYENSQTVAVASAWHHLAIVFFDNATKDLYLDGNYAFGDNDGTNLSGISGEATLYLGTTGTGTLPWNGTIDDVLIFNRSLSSEQIKAIYENKTDTIAASETNLLDRWAACITSNDGSEDGAEACSANITLVEDDAAPVVDDVLPVENTVFNIVDTSIKIAINVTDNLQISDVSANISLPNGTLDTISLSLSSGNEYETDYQIFKVDGTYNVTFVALDFKGNFNQSETTNFTINITGICGNDLCEGYFAEDLDSCSYDCGYLDVGNGSDEDDTNVVYLDLDSSSGVSDIEQEGSRTYKTLSEASYLYFNVSTSSLSLGHQNVPYRHAVLEIEYKDVVDETNCATSTSWTTQCRPYVESHIDYGSSAVYTNYFKTKGLGGENDSTWKNTTIFFENYPRQELRSIDGVFGFRIYYPSQTTGWEPLPIDTIRFRFINESELYIMREKDRLNRTLERSDYNDSRTINSADYDFNYTIYLRNYLEKIYPATVPDSSEITTDISTFEIRGNYEPLSFSFYAFEDLDNINFTINNLTKGMDTIPAENITLDKVVTADKKWRFDRDEYYGTNPWYLSNFSAVNISANTSQQFWLTIYVPEDASVGNYTGSINFSGDNIDDSEINLTLEVIDIVLEEPDATPYLEHSPYFKKCTYSIEDAMTEIFRHDLNPIIFLGPSYDSNYNLSFNSSYDHISEAEKINNSGLTSQKTKVYVLSSLHQTLWNELYDNTDYFESDNTSEFDDIYKDFLQQIVDFYTVNYSLNISISFVDEPGANVAKRRSGTHLNRLAAEKGMETWNSYAGTEERALAGHGFNFTFGVADLNYTAPTWVDTDDNLVGYWDFQDDTAGDKSGNENNGTLTGDAAIVDGILVLDGDGDYVSIPDDSTIDITSDLTVAAWVKNNITSVGVQYIAAKFTRNAGGYVLFTLNNYPFFYVYNSSGDTCAAIQRTALGLDAWAHVTGVYNGTHTLLYVDGTEEDTTECDSGFTFASSSENLTIGGNSVGTGQFTNGSITEVAIFDRVLSGTEILELGNFSNLSTSEMNITLQLDNSTTVIQEDIVFSIDKAIEGDFQKTFKRLFVNDQEIWNVTALEWDYQVFNVSISDYLASGTNNFTFSFRNRLSRQESIGLYFIDSFWRNKSWTAEGNGTDWNYSYENDTNGDLGPMDTYLKDRVYHIRQSDTEEAQKTNESEDIFSFYTTYPANQPVVLNNRFLHGIFPSAANVSNVVVYAYCDWQPVPYDEMEHTYNLRLTAAEGLIGASSYALILPSWKSENYPTLMYESLREGIEDSKIIATLKKAIADHPGAIADDAQNYLDNLYSRVNLNYSTDYWDANSSAPIEKYSDRSEEILTDLSGVGDNYDFFDTTRKTMIDYIIQLSASAVVSNGIGPRTSATISETYNEVFKNILVGTPITIKPSEVRNIDKIVFQTIKNLQNQKITVEKVTSAPASSTRIFHSFFKIDAGEIGRNLETAEISFHVERSWLDDKKINTDDIALFHWDGLSWNGLPTKKVSQDEKRVNYISTTNSFSYFAIGVKKEEVTEEIIEEVVEEVFVEEIKEERPIVGLAFFQKIKQLGKDLTVLWVSLVILSTVTIISYFTYKKRKALINLFKRFKKTVLSLKKFKRKKSKTSKLIIKKLSRIKKQSNKKLSFLKTLGRKVKNIFVKVFRVIKIPFRGWYLIFVRLNGKKKRRMKKR